MQIESKTTSSLGCFAEMQLILCKDTIFFLIHRIFTPLFLLFAEKNNDKTIVIYRQVDFSLSTSRFAAIDKSILRNFKMQVKLIYCHVATFATCFLKI